MKLVEVRIPTYKRNDMLSACLDSLISQTWSHWKAIIFDDANDSETRRLVLSKGDSRLTYKPNPVRVGAAANLNQCFQTRGYIRDSVYACCLEDDNWLYPCALESNIETLESEDVHIMMRNQDIFVRSNVGVAHTSKTTLFKWFNESRQYEPVELAARTIFYTGISNGALFWRTDSNSDLQDPYSVIDPSLQEYIRCWQIVEPVYVRLDSSLAYSDPVEKTHRHYTIDRSFSRALQQGHQRLLQKYGHSFVREAVQCSKQFNQKDKLCQCFSNIATFSSLAALLIENLPIIPSFLLRGIVKSILVNSPINNFHDDQEFASKTNIPSFK